MVAIGTMMLFAGIVAFLFLGEKSLWLDEAISVMWARRDGNGLLQMIMSTELALQGIYCLLLHVWLKFGNSEFWIRSLSAFCMLLTVPMIYALGARLGGKRAGMIAMILFITNAAIVHYAQEARSYALTILLVTTASFFLVAYTEEPSKRKCAGYIITGVLAVYAHSFAFLVLVAHAVTVMATKRRSRLWKSALISGAIIFVALLPLVRLVLFTDAAEWLSSVPETSWQDLVFIWGFLAGAQSFSPWGWVLGFCYSFLCLGSLYSGWKRWRAGKLSDTSWHYCFLVTWLLLPVAITFILSLLKPLFVYRYLLICIPPLIVLASIGIAHIENGRFAGACLAVLLPEFCTKVTFSSS